MPTIKEIRAQFSEPMLLLPPDTLPEGEAWAYELKLDGYRAIAIKTNGRIELRSRNDKDFSRRYPIVAAALSDLPDDAEFNRKFQVKAAEPGHAFVPYRGKDLDRIFALQQSRVVNRDNTVQFETMILQIDAVGWRRTLAGSTGIVHQHLDGNLSLTYGPHLIGRYTNQGVSENKKPARAAVEKTAAAPPWKSLRDSHFPTASAAATP